MFFNKYFCRFVEVLFLLFLLLQGACAKERTREEKQREEERRRTERLRRAEGSYSGYAVQGEGGGSLPAAIIIQLLQNPTNGNDKPVLQVKLRLGFFSGVVLTSTKSSFDWKTGELNASFAGSGGSSDDENGQKNLAGPNASASLELNAQVEDDKITSAELLGAYSGVSHLNVERVESLSLLATEVGYAFDIKAVQGDRVAMDATKGFARLSIKNDPSSRTVPVRSDLPFFPSLSANFSFTALNHLYSTNKVFYDPLEGTLEIVTHTRSVIRFENLFVEDVNRVTDSTLFKRGVKGEITIGADHVADVVATPVPAARLTEERPAMTKVYVGTYRPASGPFVDRVVAYLDDLNGVGINPGELAFPSYPQMRLRFIQCAGERIRKQITPVVYQVDYLNYSALMKTDRDDQNPSGDTYLLDFKFDNEWQNLKGTLVRRTSQGHGSPGAPATIELSRSAKPMLNGCADFRE